MKSESIKFSSLVLLSFIISGCGSISKTTFNELKQENGKKIRICKILHWIRSSIGAAGQD